MKESSLLMKGFGETFVYEGKEQKCVFHNTLLGTLAASLLRNVLAGKRVNQAVEGTIRAG